MVALAGKDALKEMPLYKDCPFDLEHSIRIVEAFINLKELGMFIKVVDGEVVGLFMGVVNPHWFTPMREMTELMFWVRHDYRTAGVANKLLKIAEAWAESMGAEKMTIASGTGYETDRVMKLYSRKGYTQCQVAACKNVVPNPEESRRILERLLAEEQEEQ